MNFTGRNIPRNSVFYREQFVLFQLVTRAVVSFRPVLKYYIHDRENYNYNYTSSLYLDYAIQSS